MKRNEIEQRLARAIEAATPDLLDRVLERVAKEPVVEGAPEPVLYRLPTARTKRAVGPAAGIAAAVLLVVGGWFGYGHLAVDSVIGLDVNPSVELRVNRYDRVRSAEARGGDGEAVLAGMNLKHVDLDVAVNAIIGSMLREGYLSEAQNAVLISVENGDAGRSEALQYRIMNDVSAALGANDIAGAVIGQTLSEDARIAGLAADHGISLGKAALIDMLVEGDPGLDFAQLAALPIGDIHLLIASQDIQLAGVVTTGSASEAKYIGEERAVALALDRAGQSRASLRSLAVALGYEEGHMVYRVDFVSDEAETAVMIDALSGDMVRYEKVYLLPDGAAPIALSEAQQIALAHAGLPASDVRFTAARLDEVGGRFILTFEGGGTVYTYQVDAFTGDIVAFERTENAPMIPAEPERPAESLPEAPSQPAPGEVIGEDEAKAIALSHAGASVQDAIFVKAVQYNKAGVRVYDLTFLLPTARHVYEIDAHTGDVLAFYSHPIHSAYYNVYSGDWGHWTNRDDGSGQNSDRSTSESESADYIGEAAARAAALSDAGVNERDATRMEVELKSKGGRMVYEVEFRVDREKYEYRIDAISGDVVKRG